MGELVCFFSPTAPQIHRSIWGTLCPYSSESYGHTQKKRRSNLANSRTGWFYHESHQIRSGTRIQVTGTTKKTDLRALPLINRRYLRDRFIRRRLPSTLPSPVRVLDVHSTALVTNMAIAKDFLLSHFRLSLRRSTVSQTGGQKDIWHRTTD